MVEAPCATQVAIGHLGHTSGAEQALVTTVTVISRRCLLLLLLLLLRLLLCVNQISGAFNRRRLAGDDTVLGPVVVRHLHGHSVERGALLEPIGMLLHVLRQVGLLRVGLATELANVRLEVFRFFVLGNVFEEAGLVSKTLVTTITFEWFVSLMRPGM